MSKQRQVELEELIDQAVKRPQGELHDAFTGEVFQPRSRNHYEVNDGVPVAPAVELNRPSIRQRIENLINRDPEVLRRYVAEQDDGSVDMDIPDDSEEPLTASEQNFLDMVAEANAEAAPLPDEGLPRNDFGSSDAPADPPEAERPQETPGSASGKGADSGFSNKAADAPRRGAEGAPQAVQRPPQRSVPTR